jgi:hypothetical protein
MADTKGCEGGQIGATWTSFRAGPFESGMQRMSYEVFFFFIFSLTGCAAHTVVVV